MLNENANETEHDEEEKIGFVLETFFISMRKELREGYGGFYARLS